MKHKSNAGKLLMAVLLLWLAFAPLAQAFYNPNSGRWLNRDPLEEIGGQNLYVAVNNEPLTHVDPDGRVTVSRVKDSLQKKDCGGWNVQFEFKEPNASCDGYIIQQVTKSDEYDKCAVTPQRKYETFWEIIASGKAGTDIVGIDTSNFSSKYKMKGAVVRAGVARFVCKQASGDLEDPVTGWKVGGNPTSGDARSTNDKPTWWDGLQGGASRNVSAAWDCCCRKPAEYVSNVGVSP